MRNKYLLYHVFPFPYIQKISNFLPFSTICEKRTSFCFNWGLNLDLLGDIPLCLTLDQDLMICKSVNFCKSILIFCFSGGKFGTSKYFLSFLPVISSNTALRQKFNSIAPQSELVLQILTLYN